jgi:hypothetical protein
MESSSSVRVHAGLDGTFFRFYEMWFVVLCSQLDNPGFSFQKLVGLIPPSFGIGEQCTSIRSSVLIGIDKIGRLEICDGRSLGDDATFVIKTTVQ